MTSTRSRWSRSRPSSATEAPGSRRQSADRRVAASSGQAGRPAVVGERRLGVEGRRPAGREADDPVEADRGQRGRGGRPAPGPGPHVLVEGVQREAQRRRVAAVGLAPGAHLGDPLGDLVGSRNTKFSSSPYGPRSRPSALAVAADDDRDVRPGCPWAR